MIVRHPVADWDAWKSGFDAHEQTRREAGFLGHHINRGEADTNDLSVYFAVSDIDAAKAFTASDELKTAMERVGVTGPPEFTWMTPRSVDVVWEGELPAMIITHSVADFDSWLTGYNAADELRSTNGITGHAANQMIDDPSTVLIYHQAESFDTLRSFLSNPDLQAAMKEAGVTSEPQVSFHTGGWAEQYG